MKALLSTVAGGPETLVLSELPTPVCGPGQVRIAVKACGLNFFDTLVIQDLYQARPPRPFAPGMDVAGIVEAIGANVTGVQVGARVVAPLSLFGGLAEQAVTAHGNCLSLPDNLPFEQAAGMLTTYTTSYHSLHDRGHLQPGETLLVLGAAGGVGLAAVELGKAAGAKVIAAASSEDKVALAVSHGADAGVVYPSGALDKTRSKQLADEFKAACGTAGAHVILDAVGGGYSEPALRAIAPGGRFLVVGFPAGIPQLPLNLPLLKACQIVGVFWGAAIAREPDLLMRTWRALMQLHERGSLRNCISERYPLQQGAVALSRLSGRQAKGKVVVTIEP
jgi:NADPH2:quinone reductase